MTGQGPQEDHVCRVLSEPLEDEDPQAPGADEGGDHGVAHRLDSRRSNAGEDQREGKRQLDPGEKLPPRHPHAPARVPQGRGDLRKGGVRVARNGQHRVEGEGKDCRGPRRCR